MARRGQVCRAASRGCCGCPLRLPAQSREYRSVPSEKNRRDEPVAYHRASPSEVTCPAPRLLVRQPHDECQSDIQSRDVPIVEMADLSSNSLPPNGDGLVSHHLRPNSQSVLLGRIDRYSKIRRIVALGGHLADDHRCMLRRECVRMHNHCGTWLTIVAVQPSKSRPATRLRCLNRACMLACVV